MFLSKAFGGSGTCRKHIKRAKKSSHSFIGIKAKHALANFVFNRYWNFTLYFCIVEQKIKLP